MKRIGEALHDVRSTAKGECALIEWWDGLSRGERLDAWAGLSTKQRKTVKDVYGLPTGRKSA